MAVLGLGCVAAASPRATLVFVHGIKGAKLATDSGRVRWLTAPQALGLSTPSLALTPRFDAGVQPRDDLEPAGVLSAIVLLPRVIQVPVYGPWLEAAAGLGRPFRPFAYDWRRDNLESVAAFETFLESVVRDTGRPADVVAHSMGGLIALSLLNRRPELFHRVVFAGVPFRGGIGFLPDLHLGRATGLNGKIAGRDVLATFPSVFSLFPLVNEQLVEADGSPAPMDFYDADAWERLALGPYHPGHRHDAEFKVFLTEGLRRARTFRESLAPPAEVTWPPVLVVASQTHPTLAKAIRGGPKAEDGVDFTTAPPVDGDGRVTYRGALPPGDHPREIFLTTAEHAALLNDRAVVARIADFLEAP